MPPDPSLRASIENWIIKYIEDNGLTTVVGVIVLICIFSYLLGMASLWIWKRKALIADSDKSLSEAIKNSMEIAQSLNNASNSYVDATDTINLGLRHLLDAINNDDKSQMAKSREELCRDYNNEFLRALRNLLVIREASRNTRYNRIAVHTEAIRALKTTLKFLKMVNNPLLLGKINNNSSYSLDPSTLTPVREFVRKFNPKWALFTWWEYRSFNKHLLSYES